METTKNELKVLSTDIATVDIMEQLKNPGADFICSIKDDGSRASKVRIYNAIQNADEQLADHVNETIAVVDVVAHPVRFVDDKTGEITDAVRTVLISEDGTGYQAVSTGIVQALSKIFIIIGMPTWIDEPVKMKILQKSGKDSKNKYLTIELV